MMFFISDPSFDNDDNPYGFFEMHQYTNMQGINDTRGKASGYNDYTIPIEPCNANMENPFTGANRIYCPKFNETHFIHGGFTADKFSWLRLALHICDSREEARLKKLEANKTHIECKSREESLKYFESKIQAVEMGHNEINVN